MTSQFKFPRPSVLPDLLRYYKNGDLVSSTIRVTFADEEGEDYEALLRICFLHFGNKLLKCTSIEKKSRCFCIALKSPRG